MKLLLSLAFLCLLPLFASSQNIQLTEIIFDESEPTYSDTLQEKITQEKLIAYSPELFYYKDTSLFEIEKHFMEDGSKRIKKIIVHHKNSGNFSEHFFTYKDNKFLVEEKIISRNIEENTTREEKMTYSYTNDGMLKEKLHFYIPDGTKSVLIRKLTFKKL